MFSSFGLRKSIVTVNSFPFVLEFCPHSSHTLPITATDWRPAQADLILICADLGLCDLATMRSNEDPGLLNQQSHDAFELQ